LLNKNLLNKKIIVTGEVNDLLFYLFSKDIINATFLDGACELNIDVSPPK
jgi:hypothetical protein